MTKSRKKGNIRRLAIIMNICLGACADLGDEMFNPVAHANLYVGDRVGDFEKTVDELAARRGFIVGRANFPRGDRWVESVRVDVDTARKTFMTFNNFRDMNVIEANAYSHEKESKWNDMWHNFLLAATDEFGRKNIEITK